MFCLDFRFDIRLWFGFDLCKYLFDFDDFEMLSDFLAWFIKQWGYIMLVCTELNFIFVHSHFSVLRPQPVVD